MADDVLLNKAAGIERCLERVREEYEGHEAEIENNFTRQDALVLNLLRACETAIDLAMHVARARRLGVPQSSRHAFELLAEVNLTDQETAKAMKNMVGFRNVVVHNYRELDFGIVRHIVEHGLRDFRRFTEAVFKAE